MLQSYEHFVDCITKNPSELSRWCNTKYVNYNDILPTLPLTISQLIWKPIIDSKGFSAALPQISNTLLKFIIDQKPSQHTEDITRIHTQTLLHLAPQLVLHQFTHIPAQQLGQRIKQLKKVWNLPPSACGIFIGALESKQQKEKDSQLKRQKIVSDMLILFDLNESRVDYSEFGIQLLNMSVGEAIYHLLDPLTSYEDLYRTHLMRYREKVTYLLSKIKGKELAWGIILAEIVLPQNNQTPIAKIKNICMLFLITEAWDRFRDQSSRLKDPAYVQVLAETFHRLLFHIYNHQQAGKLLLAFLQLSKFALPEELRRSIAYHLLALHKLKSGQGRNGVSKQIETIWKEKLGETRINEMFLEHAPSFLANSQKSGERALQEIESKSYRSSASKSSISSFDLRHMTSKSRKSARSTKINTLHNWVRSIQLETKKFNLEKIYLLMEGFKQFYRQEYAFGGSQDSPRSLVMGMAVNLIKKLECKLDYRYGISSLVKVIYLELAEVLEHNNCEGYAFQQSVSSLGIFEYCFIENGHLNIDTLLKLHEKHNYEQNIETLLTLKLLASDLASNTASQNIRSDQFDQSINPQMFASKIYELYKYDFIEKKLDARKLSIINRLIGLNSSNIIHNLLANYVYNLFRQGLQDTAPYRKKTNLLSQIINAEINKTDESERKRLLLLMGEIFDGFDARSKERTMNIVTTAPISNRYFEFLKRKQHDNYLLAYSEAYYKLNYLKEAIYFLQLYHIRTKTSPTSSATDQAIQLYSRLLPSFNKSEKYIRKRLNVTKQEEQQGKTMSSYRMALLLKRIGKLMSRINGKIDKYSNFTVNGKPKWDVWLSNHLNILYPLIKDIYSLREAQQVNESILRASILLRIVTFQLTCLSDSSQSSLQTLIEGIQRLPNSQDQIVFYEYLLTHKSVPMIEAVQQLYLMKLHKTGSDAQLLKHLRQDLKQGDANVLMSTYHLRYLIRYYFMRGELALAVSTLNIYYERGESEQLGELYQIELECRFRMMLNYTLQDSLGFVKSKCLDDRVGHGQDCTFFFKIFRLIFNRYQFTRLQHNDLFIETFFKFIDRRQLLTRNQQDLSDAIFYLIRFVLEKFFYSPEASKYGSEIVHKFDSYIKHFVPFCSYMIKRISSCIEKNQVIETILVAVLTKHPQECVWLISFLKNFAILISKSNNSEEEKEITRLAAIYKKVKDELQIRKNVNKSHQIWIDQLIQLALLDTPKKTAGIKNFKQLQIPSELHFVFSSQYYIHKLLDAKVLTNGKSSPLQLTFSLVHCKHKQYRPAKVIIKANMGCKKYRMESNTANFFQEIGLIDEDITYRISHLSKYLVVIEHVNNWGTINNIISTHFPLVKEQENAVIAQLAKRRSVNKDERRLLEVYDRLSPKVNIPLSRLIYEDSKNIRDWWNRNLNFIRTHAQWSFLGFIVGLGDRHTDNILMTEQCKLIHIDFEYALDTGLKLPCPEWVPFRLTKCLIEPLGILNVQGLFFAQMMSAAEQLQQREADFWRAISHFVGSLDTNITEEILSRSKMEVTGKNSRQQGVTRLIQAAKSPELLRLMFDGWRAYL